MDPPASVSRLAGAEGGSPQSTVLWKRDKANIAPSWLNSITSSVPPQVCQPGYRTAHLQNPIP